MHPPKHDSLVCAVMAPEALALPCARNVHNLQGVGSACARTVSMCRMCSTISSDPGRTWEMLARLPALVQSSSRTRSRFFSMTLFTLVDFTVG